MNIIILPSSGKESQARFDRTMVPGRPLAELASYVFPVTLDQLKQTGNGFIGVWGFVNKSSSGNKTKWDRIEPGDSVLIYKEKRFVYKARIICKEINPKLAKTLWGFNQDGLTWDLVFFLTDFVKIDEPWLPLEVHQKEKAVFQDSMVYTPESDYYYPFLEYYGSLFTENCNVSTPDDKALYREFTNYFEEKCRNDPGFIQVSEKYLCKWRPNSGDAYYVFTSSAEPLMEFTAELWKEKNSISLYLNTGYPFMSEMLSSLNDFKKELDGGYTIPPRGKVSHSVRLYSESYSIYDRNTWDGFCEWAISGLKALIPYSVKLHQSFKGIADPDDPPIEDPETDAEKKIDAEITFRISKIRSPEKIKKLIEDLDAEYCDKTAEQYTRMAKACARNRYFAHLVKERDGYRCQICGCEGFKKKDGSLYAEAHHIWEISTYRKDYPGMMICVCPTCHRVLHYGSKEALEERKALKK